MYVFECVAVGEGGGVHACMDTHLHISFKN